MTCEDLDGVYMYAQKLDGSGGVEYWKNSLCLAKDDLQLELVRNVIDSVCSSGFLVFFGAAGCKFWIDVCGLVVISFNPKTLDVSERVSPVLIVLDASKSKVKLNIEVIIGADGFLREISDDVIKEIKFIFKLIKFPVFLLILYSVISKFFRSSRNVG